MFRNRLTSDNDLRVQIAELKQRIDRLVEYVDKTLHVTSVHFDTYAQRSARPYYPLDNGWGLTTLDTGQPFFVNTEDRNITPWIIMGGHWETNVERVLKRFAQPGMTVIDVGAHMGYYTVKLGTIIGPAGRLIAFEPNPEVNSVCEENIKINALSGHVTLMKFALGDANETATLTRSISNMASANLLGEQDADYSVEVEVKRLDDVVGESLVVDLMKVDAEGYEKRILDGGSRLLARSRDCAVMIELNLDRWTRQAPLSALLPACGGGSRALFAVQADGTMRRMALDEVEPFLLTCPYHENYFFVAEPAQVEARLNSLIAP